MKNTVTFNFEPDTAQVPSSIELNDVIGGPSLIYVPRAPEIVQTVHIHTHSYGVANDHKHDPTEWQHESNPEIPFFQRGYIVKVKSNYSIERYHNLRGVVLSVDTKGVLVEFGVMLEYKQSTCKFPTSIDALEVV